MEISPVYHAIYRAPWGGDVVIIGQKTLKDKLGFDVMAKLKAFLLRECGHQYGAGVELTTRAVGEPNAGAVLRVAMAVTALGPGGNVPGDVGDEVTLEMLSQRPMIS